MASGGTRARLREFFALDDEWERGNPRIGRADVTLTVVVLLFSLTTLELGRSMGSLEDVDVPAWAPYAVVAVGAACLVGRRRFPLAVAVLLASHMFVVGVSMPAVMADVSMQICYFTALFSAMAWGRDRRTSLLVAGSIVGFMLCWVAWQFAVGSALDQMLGDERPESGGVFPAIPAGVALVFVINLLYFLGAVVWGQIAWRGARHRAGLAEQAATIARQADSLRRRAVVDERLRIARELHDVVGHHVSVIGVQAAGARRVLRRDPDAAASALSEIEGSAREAVTQMRSLLGTLRDMEGLDPDHDPEGVGNTPGGADPEGSPTVRRPEPGAADLPALAEERTRAGVATTYVLVEDRDGAAGRLSAAVGLSLYRTAQEALANVARHSTAGRASVTLRVAELAATPHVELEVLDDGRLRSRTSGSGLGLLGIRERVASHRGECEIGPRATGGYRVRVRLPLTPIAAPAATPAVARG